VVDYIGIDSALKQTMNAYTNRVIERTWTSQKLPDITSWKNCRFAANFCIVLVIPLFLRKTPRIKKTRRLDIKKA